jgi:hypothetical protein
MIYLAVLVVLITEAAKVREHLWAGVDHTHWAKRPIWPRLPASDAFHVASALSHYPISSRSYGQQRVLGGLIS